jgi:hypothetical protein
VLIQSLLRKHRTPAVPEQKQIEIRQLALNQFGQFENLIRGCLHATFAQVSHALDLGSLNHAFAGLTVPTVIVGINAETRAIQSGSHVPITECVLA